MIKLSVNINKFATLRNSRGGNNPDIVKAATDAQEFGADGVTVHPRPDERHIRYADVYAIKKIITTEFNIEGNSQEQKFSATKFRCYGRGREPGPGHTRPRRTGTDPLHPRLGHHPPQRLPHPDRR